MTPGGKFTLGGGLALTTGCAHLYTCPFWISVRLYSRGRSSDKQNRVFPRENETKVNYNKLDYKIIWKIPGWLIVRWLSHAHHGVTIVTSRAVPRERKKWETNSEPWSDVTWDGTPCFEKTWITKRRASSTEVIVSWVGMNMACFDRRSTITRMVSKPEEEGSFSMKSIEIEFHRCSGIGSCWRNPYDLWRCGLDLI